MEVVLCKHPLTLNTAINTMYIQHNHYNQRLGKIFAKAILCLTTIKWIRMSLMNMDDSWAIFVWYYWHTRYGNNYHRIKYGKHRHRSLFQDNNDLVESVQLFYINYKYGCVYTDTQAQTLYCMEMVLKFRCNKPPNVFSNTYCIGISQTTATAKNNNQDAQQQQQRCVRYWCGTSNYMVK